MGLFYDRQEDRQKTVIRFTKYPFLLISALCGCPMALLWHRTGHPAFIVLTIPFVIGIFVFSLPYLGVSAEIKRRMKETGGKVYGSKWSFKQPLTFEIPKQPEAPPPSTYDDNPGVDAEQKPNKLSAPKKSKKPKKWLFISLASIVVLATVCVGGFFTIKNKVSAYLEKFVKKNPIYLAAATGNLQKVDRLISEGANPNAKGIKGHTPLIAATGGHHSLIAEHLLLAGANPDQKDDWGWAALHHAITPTDGADLDLIGILVKHGANVNIQDNRLRTPLHRAAQYGQLQAVLLLLKYGADPNIRDYNGWTPADRAAAHPQIQSLLMSEKSYSESEVSELTEFPEYFSEKHNFKVRFPGKAKVTDYGLVTDYTVEIEAEGAYNIIVQPFPEPVLSDEAIQAALDGHLQGRLALFGDTAAVLESRHIVFAEHKALQYEYTVESQGTVACFKGVYFIVGKFGYGVSCLCTEETKRLVYRKYDSFAKSFHLTNSR